MLDILSNPHFKTRINLKPQEQQAQQEKITCLQHLLTFVRDLLTACMIQMLS